MFPPSPSDSELLGNYEFVCDTFPQLDEIFTQFEEESFQQLPSVKKWIRISEVLCVCIQKTPHPSFLLGAVASFIAGINQKNLLKEPYHITLFEFFLNHFSGLSEEDNALIRAKIAGKLLPRDVYQVFFPIGMGNMFFGTHFVSAHKAPDVDTTIASFWGWCDAFAARVGEKQHIWSLPGGPPDSPIITMFCNLFGKTIFQDFARLAPTMTLSAMDMVTESNVIKVQGTTKANTLRYGDNGKAILLVDEKQHYLGEWRNADGELVRQILILYQSCLQWLENNLHSNLISLFAKKILHISDLPDIFSSIFSIPIRECEPLKNITNKQAGQLHKFLQQIVGMPLGLNDTFSAMIQSLKNHSIEELFTVKTSIFSLPESALFDSSGTLIDDRIAILKFLEKTIHHLDIAMDRVHTFTERLDVLMDMKKEVMEMPPYFITWRSEIEDIRAKMQNRSYLAVVIPQDDGTFFPIGVVWAHDLRMPVLGTVSFRDFCNEEEVHMASYLSVISVIDHHKSTLKTVSTPSALIGDAQSCNVLIAEQLFQINERYSQGGMKLSAIEIAIENVKKLPPSQTNMRLLQQLILKQMAGQRQSQYFIHPKREFAEYLCILYAILDDTDLLTKVSARDVVCVATLLNKLKSLSVNREVETVALDNLPRDRNFAKNAAKRLLQNPEMYSLYQKIYAFKERDIEENLKKCGKGSFDVLFTDTKEQNGCCRIGQIKIFSCNIPSLLRYVAAIRDYWAETAEKIQQNRPQMDLHLLMISTIPSADEVYEDKGQLFDHQDELWFWIPRTERAIAHLTNFLNAFQTAKEVLENNMELEILGPNSDFLVDIFQRNFPLAKHIHVAKKEKQRCAIGILRFYAGSLNSRKSMVSPYLPHLIP